MSPFCAVVTEEVTSYECPDSAERSSSGGVSPIPDPKTHVKGRKASRGDIRPQTKMKTLSGAAGKSCILYSVRQ